MPAGSLILDGASGALIGAVGTADAAVTYQDDRYDRTRVTPSEIISFTPLFLLTVPDFITADTSFGRAELAYLNPGSPFVPIAWGDPIGIRLEPSCSTTITVSPSTPAPWDAVVTIFANAPNGDPRIGPAVFPDGTLGRVGVTRVGSAASDSSS